MRLKYLARPFECKQLDESGSFEGYGSVFGTVDSYKEIVAPGAFKQSLAEHKERGTTPSMLYQHDPDQPVGSYQVVREDDTGLYVRGKLVKGVQRADESYLLMKADPPALTGLSIGYIPKESKRDKETRITTLTRVDLWEVSLVTFPANRDARVEAVRAALAEDDIPTLREVEAFLRDAGMSRRQAKALVRGGYEALSQPGVGEAAGTRDAKLLLSDDPKSATRLARLLQ